MFNVKSIRNCGQLSTQTSGHQGQGERHAIKQVENGRALGGMAALTDWWTVLSLLLREGN